MNGEEMEEVHLFCGIVQFIDGKNNIYKKSIQLVVTILLQYVYIAKNFFTEVNGNVNEQKKNKYNFAHTFMLNSMEQNNFRLIVKGPVFLHFNPQESFFLLFCIQLQLVLCVCVCVCVSVNVCGGDQEQKKRETEEATAILSREEWMICVVER